MKEVAAEDTAFIERKIEIRNLARFGHAIGNSYARVGKQVADNGRAVVLIEEFLCRCDRTLRKTTVVFDHQLQGPPQYSAAFIYFLAGDLSGPGYFLTVEANHPGEGRHQSQFDGVFSHGNSMLVAFIQSGLQYYYQSWFNTFLIELKSILSTQPLKISANFQNKGGRAEWHLLTTVSLSNVGWVSVCCVTHQALRSNTSHF